MDEDLRRVWKNFMITYQEDKYPITETILIIAYLIVISPMFLVLSVYALFNKSFGKWYNDTLSDGPSEGLAMLVLAPIMFVLALLHPIETYRLFTNN